MKNNNKIEYINDLSEINIIESDYYKILIDWMELNNKEDFIKYIYFELWCPKDFWLNWDAFWDTITDNQFWVKKPLFIIFKNYNNINKEERLVLSDILIDLIQIKWHKYNVFILKNNYE